MKNLLLTAMACVVLAGCDRTDNRTTRDADNTERNVRDRNRDADNTERNVRDRSGATLTPGDQGESEGDRNITVEIRRAIMKDGSLTTYAKNIKIITKNGTVTLRGVVNSENEKANVAQKAQQVNGVQNVDNQLEVTNK